MQDLPVSVEAGLSDPRLERQLLKGREVLGLCMAQGRFLVMKGFIDSQIEQGEELIPVVEDLLRTIDLELGEQRHRSQREALRDLRDYTSLQLRSLQPESA